MTIERVQCMSMNEHVLYTAVQTAFRRRIARLRTHAAWRSTLSKRDSMPRQLCRALFYIQLPAVSLGAGHFPRYGRPSPWYLQYAKMTE